MFDYNNDIKHNISVAAYFLAEKQIPIDNLCWMLAERQLYLQNNFQKVEQNLIKQRAIQIYQTSPPYDVLCWLISEIDFLLKRNYFKINQKPHFILD
ncbi:MAG: hypothetical protein ACFFCG_04805 [Promethearchaeota archaeon]